MKLLNHLDLPYDEISDGAKLNCLWCNKHSLSMEDESPYTFQCWSCKQTGNSITFIRKFYECLPQLKKKEAEELCQMKPGITMNAVRQLGIKCLNGDYMFPVYNQKNALTALHKYVPSTNITYSSPKPCNLAILGLQNVSNSDTIWVAEGHFDHLSLYPFLTDGTISLLATCGSYFPINLLYVLKDKHVCLLYDNDQAGRDGVAHVSRNLKSNAVKVLSLSFLDWSKVTIPNHKIIPNKFDIRDMCVALTKVK